jgi:hypothetical protein
VHIEARSIETKERAIRNELVSRGRDRMGDYKKIPLDHKVRRRQALLCVSVESSLKLVTDKNIASNRRHTALTHSLRRVITKPPRSPHQEANLRVKRQKIILTYKRKQGARSRFDHFSDSRATSRTKLHL